MPTPTPTATPQHTPATTRKKYRLKALKITLVSLALVCAGCVGGGMASSFASDKPDLVEGLILLGAYVYGDYDPANALTIYGSFNDNLEENIDYTENIVLIEGGNHAQFGNYGKQDGDPDATITAEEQQQIAVEAITTFLEYGTVDF